ncbi:MAG: porin [Gemmatimonadota bacterium]
MLRNVAPMLVLALWAGRGAAQSAGAVSTKWIGGIQVQYNTTDVTGQPGSRFELRRTRIGAELGVRDWITGKIDADIASGSVVLKAVWVNLDLAPAFQVRAGQLKRPFSAIALTGYAELVTVERGVRIRGLAASDVGEEYDLLSESGYLGWDTGVAAHGSLGRGLGYEVGVFNGGDVVRGPGAAAARLSFAPLDGRPLRLSAAVSRQDVPGATGMAWEGDVEWGAFRRPGLRLLAEAMAGDNLVVAGGKPGMRGAQVAAAWYMPADQGRVEAVELEGRVSYGDPDTSVDGDDGWLLTPGLALYFFGRDRVQVNWDVYVPGASTSFRHAALSMQLQLVH